MENQQQNVNYINKLPNLAIEIILRKLSVTDRLRMERVDWFWNGKVWEIGWKGQKTLSYDVVFGGAERINPKLFTSESLGALFKRMGKKLVVLDLGSFLDERVEISPYICGSLLFLPKLAKIDIRGIKLLKAVPFLPNTLRELSSDGPFYDKYMSALPALTTKCPNLESINFENEDPCYEIDIYSDLFNNYPGLKKLHFDCTLLGEDETVAMIGVLKELEELVIKRNDLNCVDHHFSDEAFEAMIDGCKRLRRLAICVEAQGNPISEAAFCKIGKLTDLVDLVLPTGQPNVTDSVVKTISKGKNLKKLDVGDCRKITDKSIVYLVEHCKSLVSLEVYGCRKVTKKSLDAVMAEVKRRYGDPPKAFPKGPSDNGIFHFPCGDTGIDWEKAQEMTANNPWLTVEFSEELDERSFI